MSTIINKRHNTKNINLANLLIAISTFDDKLDNLRRAYNEADSFDGVALTDFDPDEVLGDMFENLQMTRQALKHLEANVAAAKSKLEVLFN